MLNMYERRDAIRYRIDEKVNLYNDGRTDNVKRTREFRCLEYEKMESEAFLRGA